jgi:preprotein translocase subunit SecD
VRRVRGFGSLILIVALAVGGLTYTFAVGNSPLLGLDLQGGVSVVLKPTTPADEETLNRAITIIRQRIDALGVAEPEITRQGDNILIQIPGVDDRDRALELVGQTAELQFRPVVSTIPAGIDHSPLPPAGSPTPTPSLPSTTPTTASSQGASEQGLAASSALGAGEVAASDEPSTPVTVSDGPVELAQGETPTTTAPTDTTSPGSTATTVPSSGLTTLPEDICSTGIPSADLPADQQVEVPQCEDGVLVATYVLGPVALTGNALSGASAQLGGDLGTEWVVNPTFKGGADGIDQFNAVAVQCYAAQATCPSGQLAIVLDGRVISAPRILTPAFEADQIQITGAPFTEGEARDLATSLRYGALPVELEQQQAQIVSATLGRDALHAGVVAGLVGLALAIVYMVAFYRFLGVLAITKLAVEGALLWTIIAYLGTNSGLALTLAGVTGIIVSIGVSLDSNVVYYEHLKEDVRNGRTIRSATDKAFHSAFSTIVKADVASLIGAFLLYWLTVGPVRGFAFYLGLAGLLDLLCSWAFMRPSVKLATRSRWLRARPRVLGLPEDRDPGTATPSARRSTVTSGASR